MQSSDNGPARHNFNSSFVNKIDKLGQTALHLAVQSKDRATVELLLQCGANVGVVAYRNRSVLHYLLDPEEEEESEAARASAAAQAPAPPPATPVDESVVVDLLKLLLSRGAPTDVIDADGKTVLHLAAENKLREALVVLLPCCDKVLAERDVWNLSALHLLLEAIKNVDGKEENEYVEIVNYMLSKCPEFIEFDDKCGGTLLHIAAQNRQKRMIQLILSHSGRS